jgi:hypothetical protein
VSTITVKPGHLGAVIEAGAKGLPRALRTGLRSAAQRGRAHLRDKLPVGVTGHLRAGWEIFDLPQGITLANSAPHAGIVERGTRPHEVNREGIDSIREWVRLKLKVENPKEAESITWAIIEKIRREGQKPLWIVRDSIGKLTVFAREEIERQLSRNFEERR